MKERILIVDDDQSVREALAKTLRRAGYETVLAVNGKEAVDVFAAYPTDLVLLDLNMPVKNGWDTFEEITTQHPLTPVVIITGRPGQLELAAAARVGALMEKPLNVLVLMETVRFLIDEPVSKRLARLTSFAPDTIYCSGELDEFEPGPLALSELRQLRKRQLDDLRNHRGN